MQASTITKPTESTGTVSGQQQPQFSGGKEDSTRRRQYMQTCEEKEGDLGSAETRGSEGVHEISYRRCSTLPGSEWVLIDPAAEAE